MSASRWPCVRAAVASAISAIVPAVDAGVAWHEVVRPSLLDGASAHRAHEQSAADVVWMTQAGSSTITGRCSWSARLYLRGERYTVPEAADAIHSEALAVTRAILLTAPPAGSTPILVLGHQVGVVEDSTTIEIELRLTADVEEDL